MMSEITDAENQHHQVVDLPVDVHPQPQGSSECFFDDDGRLKRTGSVWTASANLTISAIGPVVVSLGWSVAQLGWVTSLAVILFFYFLIWYTSALLADCYRSDDPIIGNRNHTYTDAVRSYLGGVNVKVCGILQNLELFRVAIGCTISASKSMMAIKPYKRFENPFHISSCGYMAIFCFIQTSLSQIPDLGHVGWLSIVSIASIVAIVMSFIYSLTDIGLEIATIAESGIVNGRLEGIGGATLIDMIWPRFQALSCIASAYSYSTILIEIQDTIKSPPSEAKTMKKATLLSVTATTIIYMFSGFMGYAAFGDKAPKNVFSDSLLRDQPWLFNLANVALVVYLIGAYQVNCQPLFAFVEKEAIQRWEKSMKEIMAPTTHGFRHQYLLVFFRLVWRSNFVFLTTLISMHLPIIYTFLEIISAFGFWPLTVYFPVKMYIAQKKIPKWSTRWLCLCILSLSSLIISLAAAIGSIDLVHHDPPSTVPSLPLIHN